jgi:hypothetical protein
MKTISSSLYYWGIVSHSPNRKRGSCIPEGELLQKTNTITLVSLILKSTSWRLSTFLIIRKPLKNGNKEVNK